MSSSQFRYITSVAIWLKTLTYNNCDRNIDDICFCIYINHVQDEYVVCRLMKLKKKTDA